MGPRRRRRWHYRTWWGAVWWPSFWPRASVEDFQVMYHLLVKEPCSRLSGAEYVHTTWNNIPTAWACAQCGGDLRRIMLGAALLYAAACMTVTTILWRSREEIESPRKLVWTSCSWPRVWQWTQRSDMIRAIFVTTLCQWCCFTSSSLLSVHASEYKYTCLVIAISLHDRGFVIVHEECVKIHIHVIHAYTQHTRTHTHRHDTTHATTCTHKNTHIYTDKIKHINIHRTHSHTYMQRTWNVITYANSVCMCMCMLMYMHKKHRRRRLSLWRERFWREMFRSRALPPK